MKLMSRSLIILSCVLGVWACDSENIEDSDGVYPNGDGDADGDTDTDTDMDVDVYAPPEVFDVETLADGSFGIVGQIRKVVTTFGSGENAIELSSPNKPDSMALIYGAGNEVIHQSTWGETDLMEYATSLEQLPDESLIISGKAEWFVWQTPDMASSVSNSYIRKHALDQTLIWETWIKGANHNYLIAEPFILSDQSIIVAGEFYGSTSFGDGDTQQTLTAPLSGAGFIARYDAGGVLLWVQQIRVYSIHGAYVTKDDTIVLSGACDQSCSFNNEEVVLPVDIDEGYGAFLAEFGIDGSLHYAKLIGEMDWDSGVVAISSPDDCLYITGQYNEFVTLGQGTNQVTLTNPDRFFTPYLSKFSATGDLLWATSLDISHETWEPKLLSDGRILFAGWEVDDEVQTSSSSYSFSLISNENTQDITTETVDIIGEKHSPLEVHLSDNSLYFTGWYKDKIVFTSGDTSLAVENSTFVGAMFLAKVTLEGTIELAVNIAGHNDSSVIPPLIDW